MWFLQTMPITHRRCAPGPAIQGSASPMCNECRMIEVGMHTQNLFPKLDLNLGPNLHAGVQWGASQEKVKKAIGFHITQTQLLLLPNVESHHVHFMESQNTLKHCFFYFLPLKYKIQDQKVTVQTKYKIRRWLCTKCCKDIKSENRANRILVHGFKDGWEERRNSQDKASKIIIMMTFFWWECWKHRPHYDPHQFP